MAVIRDASSARAAESPTRVPARRQRKVASSARTPWQARATSTAAASGAIAIAIAIAARPPSVAASLAIASATRADETPCFTRTASAAPRLSSSSSMIARRTTNASASLLHDASASSTMRAIWARLA
jgi:hypothetical protein